LVLALAAAVVIQMLEMLVLLEITLRKVVVKVAQEEMVFL
jgi:hypothetical protein